MYIFNPLNWYHNQESPVKAATIIGTVTLVTVCMGFLIKDYIIPILLERRKRKNEKVSVFKNYRIPLRDSASSLKRRLDEIFRTRAHILWSDNPDNDFYNYKIISTNYRLCSLLGWIYAFRLEESYLQVPSKKLHKTIIEQLDAFSTSLADGQGVEMDVAKRFLALLNIDYLTLNDGIIETFSVQIDHIVQKVLGVDTTRILSDVSQIDQDTFLLDLSKLTDELLGKKITIQELKRLNFVGEASVRLGLIYRDWQQGIGDLMIKERKKDSGRNYDIISFREFENILLGNEPLKKLWLKRTIRLFDGLDVSKDNRADYRIEQLKRINNSLEKLIAALDK